MKEISAKSYRKRPVIIQAIRAEDALLAAAKAWDKLPWWLVAAYEKGAVLFVDMPRSVEIATLEGRMVALPNDWIIQGVKGELYPCKPDIFEATYEAVPPTQASGSREEA